MVYKEAVHYWSFDNSEIRDLKNNTLGEVFGVIDFVPGPANLAVQMVPDVNSGMSFGDVQESCLVDPSLCSSGLTIAMWLKYEKISRMRFFLTSAGDMLGVLLESFNGYDTFSVTMKGSSHDCRKAFPVPHSVWSFVCFTWMITDNGKGKVTFYYNGVPEVPKFCVVESTSFAQTPRNMRTGRLSEGNYSLDELTIWNQALDAATVMQIYSNITRESNFHVYRIVTYPRGNLISQLWEDHILRELNFAM